MVIPKKQRKIKDFPTDCLPGWRQTEGDRGSDRGLQSKVGCRQDCGLHQAGIWSTEKAVQECWWSMNQQLHQVSAKEGTLGLGPIPGAEWKAMAPQLYLTNRNRASYLYHKHCRQLWSFGIISCHQCFQDMVWSWERKTPKEFLGNCLWSYKWLR